MAEDKQVHREIQPEIQPKFKRFQIRKDEQPFKSKQIRNPKKTSNHYRSLSKKFKSRIKIIHIKYKKLFSNLLDISKYNFTNSELPDKRNFTG